MFLDDTQLARTALESQFITSSLFRGPDFVGLDPSVGPATEETSEFANYLLPNHAQGTSPHGSTQTLLKRRQSSSPIRSPGKRLHVLSALFVPAREDAGFSAGYVGSQPAAGASFSAFAREQTHGHVVEQRQSTCSRSDDIPSQLPSTYALSDVTSRASPERDELPPSSPVQAAPFTPFKRVGKTTHPTSSHLRRSSRTRTGFSISPRHGVTNLSPKLGIAVDRHSNARIISKPSTLRSGTEPTVAEGYSTKSDNERGNEDLETSSKSLAITASKSYAGLRATEAGLDRSNGKQHAAEASNAQSTSGLEASIRQDHSHLHITETIVSLPPPPRPVTKAFMQVPVTPPKPAQLAELKSLSISIDPGPPPTSSDSFSSHITQDLAHLSNLSMLKGAYGPSWVTRSLRQSERGHWLVDSSGWSAGTQISFWRFLEEYVGTGKFGWGIWCTRELDHQSDGNHSTAEPSRLTTEPQPCLGQVKVFCWGEVVQHIWQVLFVASKAQIRRGTPAWIGADGEVVVQMKRMEEEEKKN